jgi:hypothetical protein
LIVGLSTLGGLTSHAWALGACGTIDSCHDVTTEAQCNNLGGVVLEGEECASDPCGVGACCVGTNCVEMEAFPCIISGREFAGAGTMCIDDPCGAGIGACCLDGNCTYVSPEDCDAAGGVWRGAGTDCTQGLCVLGSCCLPGICEELARYECDDIEGVFEPGADCVTDPCEVPNDCATNSLQAQSPDGPTAFVAYKSETASGLQRFENFSGTVGAIESVRWWGFDVLPTFEECVETDNTFQISFHESVGGFPGEAICSYTLDVTVIPTGLDYVGHDLNRYEVVLPISCLIVDGWISIVGQGTPNCQFFWLSSPDGDEISICNGCQSQIEDDDLSFCLGGSAGNIFGSCCNQSTAACADAVELTDCIGPGLRFTPDVICAELDPPCAQVSGGCCFDDGTCFQDLAESCTAAGGNWLGPNASCDLCPKVGACCIDEMTCLLLTEPECDEFSSLWLGQGASCSACPEPPVCPGGGLFSQSPDPPSDFLAGTSEQAADFRRAENFTSVAGAIEGLRWWGLDLEYVGGNNFIECVETTNLFEISFHKDAGGVPGPEVCSYQLPAGYLPTGGLKYRGTELNEYGVTLPTPCVLVNGWISIVGHGAPDCWFLWMGSPDGDAYSHCDNCRPSEQEFDLNACFAGSVGGVFGSCCTDGTAECNDGVEITACLDTESRFSTEIPCSELDPPCGTIIGACCTDEGGCTIEEQFPCVLSGGNWLGANTLCDRCPCVTPCPDGGQAEAEPVCGNDYEDIFNGGCFAAVPQFSPISLGDTICGESGVFEVGLETTGDFDWYQVEVPVATQLSWSVTAEFSPRIWIFDGNAGCAGAVQLATNAVFECDEAEISTFVNPGTYWLVAAPGESTDTAACPSRYTARISEKPIGFRLVLAVDSLSWTSQIGADRYDVVRGSLGSLRSSGGDFGTATEECLADNLTATSMDYFVDPDPDQGFWFLVRAVGTTGNGTYDTGEPGQQAPRDAGIDSSPHSCP